MLDGNADATEHVDEYYPAYTKEDGTKVEAINGGGSETPTESKTYTVWFNGSDEQSTPDYFSFGTSENKHNFNSKFAGTYDGTSYASGLKMEGTTLIEFTNASTATVIIVQSTWSENTIKLDGEELSIATATTPDGSDGVRVYTIEGVAPGNHKIQRGSGESGVFYVVVREGGTSAIAKPAVSGTVVSTEYYDLQGRRIEAPTHGVMIRVERMSNGQKKVTKMIR